MEILITDGAMYHQPTMHIYNFNKVIHSIKRWPSDSQMIMQPIVRQLEKKEAAETFHSLLKFALYFDALQLKELEVLDPDYQLPGCTL